MYLDTEKCIQIQKIFVRKQSRKGEWKSFCSYLVVFSSEHLYSHDGKNEPENEADQKDVEDTGNGLHESIYNDLGQKEDGKIETFPSSLSFFKAVALQETEPACSSVICKSTILGGSLAIYTLLSTITVRVAYKRQTTVCYLTQYFLKN